MYVKVRVFPDNKKEVVQKTSEHMFEIRVKEPAERNLANQRIKELIAKEYAVLPKQVRLVSGHRSSTKIVDVITG